MSNPTIADTIEEALHKAGLDTRTGAAKAALDSVRSALGDLHIAQRAPRRAAHTQTGEHTPISRDVIDVEARVCGLSILRYLDRRTHWQAQRDLSGLATLVLRLSPPSFFMARLAAVMTDTFNFGAPEVHTVGHRHLRVEVRGVPQRLCAWLEHSLCVYGQAAVLASGRKGVEVRALPPAHSPQGSTVQLYVDMRWGA